MSVTNAVPHAAHLACSALIFEWTQATDTKSWAELTALFAPTIRVDYSAVGRLKHDAAPSALFVKGISSVLDNPNLKTQHFVGAQKWTALSDGTVRCDFQVRLTHCRVDGGAEGGGAITATAHGWNTMEFGVVEGQYRIVGVKVGVIWIDGDWAATMASKL